jgi:DtxR family Mn-dependent transcriptional regulator
MAKEKYISEAVENYLKAIYQLRRDDNGVSAQEIAASIGVSGPAVTKMLYHLAKHQFILHTPYRPVCLTPLGEKVALEVIRHHRLIELYLTESLGYGWEKAHAEAERLEHHISEEFEDAIERLLNYPAHDPHGDPIPTRDGQISPTVTDTLESQADGTRVMVRRVTDEDPALLCYLADRGLRPGTAVVILSREPFGGPLRMQVGDREESVSPQAASNVFVEAVSTLPTELESITSKA